MNEHKLNLSKETRDKMREAFNARKNFGKDHTPKMFWASSKQGTYSNGNNERKRNKKGFYTHTIPESGSGHGG